MIFVKKGNPMNILFSLILGVSFAAEVAISATPAASLRNFRELTHAFSKLTDVQSTEILSPAFQAEAKSRLSSEGKIDSLTAPMMLTVSKLGFMYCRKFLEKEAAQDPSNRRVHKDIDFKKDRTQLTPEVLKSLFENYSTQFWRRSISNSEITELLSSTKVILDTIPASAAEVSEGLSSVCTVFLTSLDVLSI